VHSKTNKETDTLQEVVITSSRIDLPFKENSRTIQLITEDIKNQVTNVADALQQIAGIDVRRRGTSGMLIYIYGAEVLIRRCYL
jgi:iron complex outermembrane receptor protein